jgi:hypothetical protein
MWKETLPENCPPETARGLEQDVFRILQNEIPTANDFIPYAKLYPNNKRYKNLCKAYAISFYDNLENTKEAYKFALKRGKIIGKYIGKFKLTVKDGLSEYDSRNGHISTWFYKSWDFNNFNCSFVTSINEN